MYTYRGMVTKVVDGDTVDVMIDLGFSVFVSERLRLLGIDTPERGQDGWDTATRYLQTLLPEKSTVLVATQRDRQEKYGRYLADIYPLGETLSVSTRMLRMGLAKPYDGGPRPKLAIVTEETS